MPAARIDDAPLTSLMNVGRAVGARFEALGLHTVGQLAGADPLELFERMAEQAGHREDPCLLDTLLSAVDQAEGKPGRPWWHYTPQRRALLAGRPQSGTAS
jgi:hypothetical protein